MDLYAALQQFGAGLQGLPQAAQNVPGNAMGGLQNMKQGLDRTTDRYVTNPLLQLLGAPPPQQPVNIAAPPAQPGARFVNTTAPPGEGAPGLPNKQPPPEPNIIDFLREPSKYFGPK